MSLQEAARARLVRQLGRAFLILFAAAHLWASDYFMGVDGISYLDIGDACFHGNWGAGLNEHWSPLYALALGAARRIFSVPMKWEYPLVHIVNFAIFLLVIACFEFFWSTVFRSELNPVEQRGRPEAAWWLLGYAIFAITAHMQKAIEHVTPDLMVTGFVLLAAGMLLRVRTESPKLADLLGLGAALGFGYLAKAPMFPMAFLFLIVAVAHRGFHWRQVVRLAIMFLVFAIISAPLVLLLSKRGGRLTFGESGRLNLAWKIDGVSWAGGAPSFGIPIHPPRHILASPDVYEFASPIHATYPLQYDPFYWNEGIQPRPNLHGILHMSVISAKLYLQLLFLQYYVLPLTIFLLLAALRQDIQAMFRHLLTHWPLLLIAVSAMCMFGAILVEPRYVAGYLLLLWPPFFLATGAFSTNDHRLANAAALSLAIMVLPMLANGVIEQRKLTCQQNNLNTALAVKQAGIRPGDKIAYVGDPLWAVWAKLDKISIVAEVRSLRPGDEQGTSFWQSSDSEQAAVYGALIKIDARAIFAAVPSIGVPNGWHQVDSTQLCVKFLR